MSLFLTKAQCWSMPKKHRRWRAKILLWRHDQQVLLQFRRKTSRISWIWSLKTLRRLRQISLGTFWMALGFLALLIWIYIVSSLYWLYFLRIWKYHFRGKKLVNFLHFCIENYLIFNFLFLKLVRAIGNNFTPFRCSCTQPSN